MDFPSKQHKEYFDLLLEQADLLGLTALRDPEKIYREFIYDPVQAESLACLDDVSRIADIGTGGGNPGISWAILHPEIEFVLIDSEKRKIRFLETVKERLGLENLSLVADRLEIVGRENSLREQFDLVTAKALARLPLLLEYVSPLLKVGGTGVLFKAQDWQQELKESEKAQVELSLCWQKDMDYSFDEKTRVALLFKKIAPVSSRYPRRVGIPKKRPLV